jgi:hypothetical protein
MSDPSKQNEGFRVLEEFICQAIALPASNPPEKPEAIGGAPEQLRPTLPPNGNQGASLPPDIFPGNR